MKRVNRKPLVLEELMKDSSNVLERSVSQRTSYLFQGSIRKYAVLVVALPLLAFSVAQAQPTALDISLSADGSSLGYWTPAVINTGTNFIVNNISYGGQTSAYTLSLYNTTVGYDPFISASVDVVNNTATTQNYNLIFTLPISPAIVGGSKIGGSVQGGLTDANNDGIGTLSTITGVPMFYGQIDGTGVLQLFPDPTSMNVPFQGGSTSQFTSAGLPGPTINGPSASTSIGIQYQFSLTPGDRATFTGFFDVVPVPEPGAIGLATVGGLLMLIARARRIR